MRNKTRYIHIWCGNIKHPDKWIIYGNFKLGIRCEYCKGTKLLNEYIEKEDYIELYIYDKNNIASEPILFNKKYFDKIKNQHWIIDGSYIKETNKKIFLHRFIWELEYGSIDNKLVIDHKDFNKFNCVINNLYIMSLQENAMKQPIKKQRSKYKRKKWYRKYEKLNDNEMLLIITNSENEEYKIIFNSKHYNKIKNGQWCILRVKRNPYISGRLISYGEQYILHNLLYDKEIPKGYIIYHKNGDPFDLRDNNLDITCQDTNNKYSKTPINNTSGIKGIGKTYNGKWRAQLIYNKKHYSKIFDTKEEVVDWLNNKRKEFNLPPIKENTIIEK